MTHLKISSQTIEEMQEWELSSLNVYMAQCSREPANFATIRRMSGRHMKTYAQCGPCYAYKLAQERDATGRNREGVHEL